MIERVNGFLGDNGTVPQDSDTLSDLEYLIDSVGYIENTDTLSGNGANNVKEGSHFPITQGGGGLIKHQELQVAP